MKLNVTPLNGGRVQVSRQVDGAYSVRIADTVAAALAEMGLVVPRDLFTDQRKQ